MLLRRHIPSLLLFTGLVTVNFGIASQEISLNATMGQALQNYVQSENISQVVVAVGLPKQKTLVFTNSKASLNKDYFPIASISKTFTAALIVQLAEQGKLQLSDTVGLYFPQYPKWDKITVGMLINQTSGLPDYINTPNFFITMAEHPNHLYSSQELLNLAYNMQVTFQAGQGWGYSNTNYLLLGLIAEKVSGQTLQSLYEQNLFSPFDLKHTVYSAGYYPKNVQSSMMPGFYASYSATPTNMTWGQGAAGIVSTPQNLIAWARVMYTNQVPHYFQMIQENRLALSNGEATDDFDTPSYSLGVFSLNTPYGLMWYTPGLASGYRNMLAYLPCQDVFIVSSINNGNTGMAASAKLLTLVMQTLLGTPTIQKEIIQYQAANILPAYCKIPRPTSINLPLF